MGERLFPTPAQQHLLETVRLELVAPADVPRWDELVTAHHYLRNATLFGEVLRYAAVAEDGAWCTLFGYSSASLHLQARDAHLGWSAAQPECRRHFVTQNSRLILLPGVACPNLASRPRSSPPIRTTASSPGRAVSASRPSSCATRRSPPPACSRRASEARA